MPRPAGKVPSYCRHKRSGQAVVRVAGRDHYLGRFGSPDSHERYEKVIAAWRAEKSETSRADSCESREGSQATEVTVNELLLRYDSFASSYYVKAGKKSQEYYEMRLALRPLRELYGRTPAPKVGPRALRAVRQKMVQSGLSRGVINHRVNRIKRFFRWAVSEELIPPRHCEALRTLPGLQFGRTQARETEPVKPVPRDFVEATLPFVSAQVAGMIQLQLLTGMRPCEVVLMRACDIDMTGEIWIFEPHDHKNRWRGHRRQIALGPHAQEIVRQFLKLESTAYLFSPADAERERNRNRRVARRTPMTPSQSKRRPKDHQKRPKRDRYDTASYRRAIKYGIKKANKSRAADDQIPEWYPLQLRHTRATEIRRQFGIEAAQVVLGHARADVTEIYAERNLAAAMDVAKQIG